MMGPEHCTSSTDLNPDPFGVRRANTVPMLRKMRTSARIGAETKSKSKTRTIGNVTSNNRKQHSLRLTLKLKKLISTFIESEPVPSCSAPGSDGWKRKLFTFLHVNDDRVLLEDVSRWIETHSWIVRDALARQCRVGTQQMDQNQNQNQNQSQNQNQNQNRNQQKGQMQIPREFQVQVPQGDSDNDSDKRKLDDCIEAHQCIMALSKVLHRRDEFRSALVNLAPIATQISRVQSKVVLGIPRVDMLNQSQGIHMRIKQDVSSTSQHPPQNQNQGQDQGQGQGQGHGGHSLWSDDDDE